MKEILCIQEGEGEEAASKETKAGLPITLCWADDPDSYSTTPSDAHFGLGSKLNAALALGCPGLARGVLQSLETHAPLTRLAEGGPSPAPFRDPTTAPCSASKHINKQIVVTGRKGNGRGVA